MSSATVGRGGNSVGRPSRRGVGTTTVSNATRASVSSRVAASELPSPAGKSKTVDRESLDTTHTSPSHTLSSGRVAYKTRKIGRRVLPKGDIHQAHATARTPARAWKYGSSNRARGERLKSRLSQPALRH